MSANPGITAAEPHPYLGPHLELPVFMAEQEQERRKHWTGGAKTRLRQYQREWEVRSQAREDPRQDSTYQSRRPIDARDRTDEK